MDKMNNSNTDSINTYERIVFITRLSAIGDVIIASHTISKLILNGYFPVFITSHTTKDIALSINGLEAFICYQKDLNDTYYIKGTEVKKDVFIQEINKIKSLKKNIYIDLQKTSRSKRAYKFLTKNLNIKIEDKFTIPKMTFYRLILIIFAFFTLKQKIRENKPKLNRIQNIQESLIKKIILADKNDYKNRDNNYITLKNDQPYFNDSSDYICIFPGASGFIKTWPKEKFRELIEKIIKQSNYKIIICGLINEIYLGEYLDFPKNSRILNLVNKTTLTETLNIISHSKYIVTNDSFAAHGADAFRIPASILFGSTTPSFGFIPIYHKISIEYINLSCSPCSRHGKGNCRFKNLKCFQDIDTQSVFNNILNLNTKN